MTDAGFWVASDLAAVAGRGALYDSPSVSLAVIGGADVTVGRHLHRTHDELGCLLAGAGTLVIGGQAHELAPGCAWAIPAGVPHSAVFRGAYRLLTWFTPFDDPADPDRVELP